MTGFRGLELERRIDGERLAELLAALALAVRRAMDEGEVLVRARKLPVAQPFLDRALEGLRRSIVVPGFVLLKRELERRRAGPERGEDRSPDRMTGFGGRQLEVRIDAQGFAEFLAAGALARGSGGDENRALVRMRGLPGGG